MNDICELIQIGALCSYGRNMARLALTAINVNQEEFDAHIKKKQCPAGVCKSFANYVIVPKDCKVIANGTGIFGGWDSKIASRDIKSPVLEITGSAIFGGVEVKE